MKRNRLWIALLAAILLLSVFTGCAAKAPMAQDKYSESPAESAPAASEEIVYAEMDFGYTAGMTTDGKAEAEGMPNSPADAVEGSVGSANSAKINRKIIWTVDLEVQTLEFDVFLDKLDSAVNEFGGYFERSSVSGTGINYVHNRNGYLTVRIPSAKLDDFIGQVGEMGSITHTNKSSEDITLTYVDVENRIASLQLEMEKLTELMEEAASLDAVIQLEARLSEVRYQLESYTSTRNRYDSLVDYSTVNINLYEVNRVTNVPNETIGERIAAGWSNTMFELKEDLENLLVWFVVNLPYLVIWAVIITAAVVILVKLSRRRKAKKAAAANPTQYIPPVGKGEKK